jgi:hypothetical protein
LREKAVAARVIASAAKNLYSRNVDNQLPRFFASLRMTAALPAAARLAECVRRIKVF